MQHRPAAAPTAAGAPPAFADTYDQHYLPLVRVLVLSGCSIPEAEDTAQEAFARAFTRWNRIQSGSSPAGYVYRTAFRLARRSKRRDERRRRLSLTAPRPSPTSIGLRLEITEALTALPRRQRECLLLRFVSGFTTREISNSLGLRESTVRTHLQSGRTNLEQQLKADTVKPM